MSPGELNITHVGDKLFLGGYGNYLPADPVRLQSEVESFRYILSAIYAWLAWEHIVTFSVEWQRWKQLIKRREVVLVNICVIVSRYLSWTNAISSAFFFFGNPFSCQSTFTWIFVTYFLIWAFTATIFIVRVQSLYPGKRNLHRFVWVIFAVVSCLWVISLGFFYSARLPPQYRAPRMPECTAAPSSYLHVLGFGGSMCFDVLILSLTVYSALNNFASRRTRHGVMSAQVWVLETAIIYAAVCLACNTALFFVWIFQKNVILRAYPIPFAIVVNPIVASRIVFHGATWGSKTALLESRLVKITEDDVANWQRDPGVVGASPTSRRPSHTHIMLPLKGDSKSRDSSDKSFGRIEDERLGFEGLFVSRAGGHVSKRNITPEPETEAERASQEISFRRPFASVMEPQRAARRTNGYVGRFSAQRSEKKSPLSNSTSDAARRKPVSPTDSTLANGEEVAVKTGTLTPDRESIGDIASLRRQSDPPSSTLSEEHEVVPTLSMAPRGWTIQEMLSEDIGPEDDVERNAGFAAPVYDMRQAAPTGVPSNRDSEHDNVHNPRVTISQQVTTRID